MSPPKSWLASSLRFSSPAEGTEIEAWAELSWEEDKMGINQEGGREKGRGGRGGNIDKEWKSERGEEGKGRRKRENREGRRKRRGGK